VATAAALNCNIITTPGASTIELLGKDYTYLVASTDTETVNKMVSYVQKTYGTEVWTKALAQMGRIKRITSIGAIIKAYTLFFSKFKN
jgi:hypothetical protein